MTSAPPLLGKPILWAAFAALVLAVPAMGFFARDVARPPLPVLGELPAFQLVDQKGRPFSKDDLAGHAWAVNFVYTRCSATCPMLTAKMKGIQDRVTAEGLTHARLLSLSVDPERDTPEAMAGYAQGFGARDELWRFLTGPLDEVHRTVVNGFKIAIGKVPAPALAPGEAFEVLHGEKFVLVDGAGRIRGYYDADDAGLQALMKGLRRLQTDGVPRA